MIELVITFLASFLIWFLFLGLLILWVIDGRIKKEQALHALMASVIAWTIANMIKSLYPTLRPYEINNLPTYTFTGLSTDSTFPSAHAAVSFGLSYTIWLHDKRLGIYYLLGALGVGVGRVLANVHFFIDIFAGAALGSVVALVVDKLHLYKLVTNKNS